MIGAEGRLVKINMGKQNDVGEDDMQASGQVVVSKASKPLVREGPIVSTSTIFVPPITEFFC